MSTRRSPLFYRRMVRVEDRKVIARFLGDTRRAAVITFPTHGDAKRAAARLIVQLRLARTDEEWDSQLLFRTELIRAYDSLADEDAGNDE
ncbi:MAG TPA: hypothetical protein VF618_19510 [Thermoanaerobaculia bacterium]